MKKRMFFFSAMHLFALLSFAQYSGSGSGTESDPYLIMNATQLSQMANFLGQEGVVFKLQKNIDLSSWIAEENPRQGWAPIGVSTEPFKGILIGNNKTISGLTITRSSESNVGFFGCLDGATISDLTIEGSSLTGSSYLGTLAGKISNSTITNCHVKLTGNITAASGEYVGGFIGYASNTSLTNCDVEATITGTGATFVGGFGGGASDETAINSCTAEVTVSSNTECVSGLLGYSKTVTITNTNVSGNVTGTSCVAGFIAKAEGTDNITNCSYRGDLVGDTNIGGISAYLAEGSSSMFTSCCTRGKITASGDYVGGIVGVSQGACIAGMESCSHYGDIEAGSYVGGLVGASNNITNSPVLHTYTIRISSYNSDNPSINIGQLYGTYSDKVVDGITNENVISNCCVIGNIYGNEIIGGMIGYNVEADGYKLSKTTTYASQYENRLEYSEHVYWYKFVDGVFKHRGMEYVRYYGSLERFSTNTYSRNMTVLNITNCTYMGSICGRNYLGGLAGLYNGGSILENYTNAEICGQNEIGGIVGVITSNSSADGCYNHTIIRSNVCNNMVINAIGQVPGRIYGSADPDYVTVGDLGSSQGNRAWSKTQVIVNGVIQEVEDNLQNGTSVGTNTLKTKANYQAWGWDFDNDWNILEGESYPYKKYQAAPPSIESDLVSQATTISGRSVSGGTVYLSYKGQEPMAIECVGDTWSVDVEPLQSGASVEIYAETDNLVPSYPVTFTVSPLGSGTEDDPYQIYTAYDLQGISNRGYYKLKNDIDVTDWISENSPAEGWVPVGKNGIETVYIDGDKHKVKGLWSNTSSSYNGLFGNLSGGGFVKNLSVEVEAGKKLQGGDFGGVLAGYAIDMIFENCIVNGSVESSSYAGGLVGYAKGGSISQCFSKGNVKATGEHGYAGGMVAYSSASMVNSYSMANVEASEYVAGLVAYSVAAIDKCYAQGNVTGMKYGAGIVAQLDGSAATITNSAALNETITMPAQYAWACRVVSGYKNGSPDPDDSNLALSTMQVILNGKVEKKYDDEMEGTGKTQSELMEANVYVAKSWEFPEVWSIKEGSTYPFLVSEIKRGDVNKDGSIDVSDAIAISNNIIKRPSVMFIEEAADMNGDGVIDISDAIGVMNLILGRHFNH